jgi:hypothetical protein
MSRELDYRISTEVMGRKPFDWRVSDRLAKEFSYGNRHHGSPCMVCGRRMDIDDLECLPKFSSSLQDIQPLVAWLEDQSQSLPPLDLDPRSFCLAVLRARGKEEVTP